MNILAPAIQAIGLPALPKTSVKPAMRAIAITATPAATLQRASAAAVIAADGLSLSAAAKVLDGPLTGPAADLALARGLIDALGKADAPSGGKLGTPALRPMRVAYLDTVNVLPLNMQPRQQWFVQAIRKIPDEALDAGQVAAALKPLLPLEQNALTVMIDNVAADRRTLVTSGFVGDDPTALIRELSDLTSGKTAPNVPRKAVLQKQIDAYNAVVDDHNTLNFALSLVGDLVAGRNGQVLHDEPRLQRLFAECNTYALEHQKKHTAP